MSEYWVSKKKYWCQYCETYIADDAPSRTQHEGGLRHKGNKERYIRNLYKTGMKKKQESEEEKRAMKLVDAAAQMAFAQDVSSGSARALPATSASSASKPKPSAKPADPFANYTTAKSLGIEDPDADLEAAEKLRKSEGIAGEWVSVVPPPPPLPSEDNSAVGVSIETETNTIGQIRKRDGEPVDEDDIRRFKLRRKTVAVGLGEIYDPGVIIVKPREEVVSKKEDVELSLNGANSDLASSQSERPVWSSRGWKKAGESTLVVSSPGIVLEEKSKVKIETNLLDISKSLESEQNEGDQTAAVDSEIKKEESSDSVNVTLVKLEQPESSNTSLFRKRKVPVNSSAGKRKER